MMDNQLSKENITRNLKDAGCDHQQIHQFMQYFENKNFQKQMLILKCQRCQLREEIHIFQKKIDCLDYLIYMLKKEESNNGK